MSSDTLAQGLAQLGLELDVNALERLVKYIALLQKWNKVYNLTAVTDARRIVSHHLLDSLAVLPHLETGRTVDVGSGAGLPGIPLAIGRPQTEVTLLDASEKKAAFLRQAVIELGLANASVVCERAEKWRPATRFRVVISRAFSDIGKFLEIAGGLCVDRGTIAAMRGRYPDKNVDMPISGYMLKRVIPLRVPGIDAGRHLVLFEPARART